MPIWHAPAGATLAPQSGGVTVPKATRLNGPLTAIALSVRLAKPVLVTSTFCVALLVLIVRAVKMSAAGTRLIPGTAPALPVPLSVIVCGEPGALLTITMLPVRFTAVSGVKVMLIGQAMPTARVEGESGQEVVKPKSPLAVMLVIESSAVPELPSVTVVGGLVVLTLRAINVTVAGVSETAGVGRATAVPESGNS